MVSNPNSGNEVVLPKFQKTAEGLLVLWKDFVVIPTQIVLPSGASAPIVDDNADRVFLGIYLSSGTGRVGLENPQTTTTGMDLSSSFNPSREWFIERDKRITTSAWFGLGVAAPCTINVYQVLWRGH